MPEEVLVTGIAVRKYHWPITQLNTWLLVMCGATALNLGVFAYLMSVQTQLTLGIPWILPYMVTVGSLGFGFILLIVFLIVRQQLLPGVVIIGAFMLFVLWLTGLIETSVQLYGSGGIYSSCNNYILGSHEVYGISAETLASLAQTTICNIWIASFSFQLVAVIFYFWLMIMSYKVQNDEY